MICKLGKNLLEVDVESTKRFYNNANIITDSCNCDGCNNFVSGTDKLPNEVLLFFSQFGININKPAEIFVNCAEDNGKSLFYAGFYHICGKMLSETDCWKSYTDLKGSTAYSVCDENLYFVTEDLSVGFSKNINLKEKDFPTPIIQMEILFHHFPWTLNKENKFR